jgi:ribosomal protein L20A (L18A)
MKKRIIYKSTGYWTTETWEDTINYYKKEYGETDEQQILEMIYTDSNRDLEDERELT